MGVNRQRLGWTLFGKTNNHLMRILLLRLHLCRQVMVYRKSYRRRARLQSREKRRFARDRFWRGWSEWIALDTTHHALAPIVALVVLSGVIGWSMGASRSACPALVLPSEQTGIR